MATPRKRQTPYCTELAQDPVWDVLLPNNSDIKAKITNEREKKIVAVDLLDVLLHEENGGLCELSKLNGIYTLVNIVNCSRHGCAICTDTITQLDLSPWTRDIPLTYAAGDIGAGKLFISINSKAVYVPDDGRVAAVRTGPS